MLAVVVVIRMSALIYHELVAGATAMGRRARATTVGVTAAVALVAWLLPLFAWARPVPVYVVREITGRIVDEDTGPWKGSCTMAT